MLVAKYSCVVRVAITRATAGDLRKPGHPELSDAAGANRTNDPTNVRSDAVH